MADTGYFMPVIIALVVGITGLVFVYIRNVLKSSEEDPEVKNEKAEVSRKKKSSESTSGVAQKGGGKKKPADKWAQQDSGKQNFSHGWLLTSLKGHSGRVLDMDFSGNGKFLATCAEDRAVILWSTKDWDHKDHKSLRFNIQFDHAKFIKWSPDCKAFIIQRASDNVTEVYKVTRKPDGWLGGITKAITFPRNHQEELVGLGIACNGKFIMTCSEKTELTLWGLKAQQLAKIDTLLVATYSARISPCGRFVVASGFTPDVRVWEVCFNKSGDFQNVVKVFELTGHTAGVYDMGFSADSGRMATVSKDGTWKVFNTKIEYKNGEEPRLLVSGKYSHDSPSCHIAMSPDGNVVAIANGSNLALFSVLTGECDQTIKNIYSGDITCVQFDSLGKYVLTTGDKHVRVFHNVTGYRAVITSTKASFRQGLSTAQRERMEQQISSAQEFLNSIGEEDS